jgi:hypothetical protein
VVRVEYRLYGYLTADRRVRVRWRDYADAGDTRLLPLDEARTTIDFMDPIQVARGTPVSDANGERRATVLFPGGTQACAGTGRTPTAGRYTERTMP